MKDNNLWAVFLLFVLCRVNKCICFVSPGLNTKKTWSMLQRGKKKTKEVVVENKAKPAPVQKPPPLTAEQRMKQTPIERVIYDMAHNERVVNDIILGRRISFYELRGEVGAGNFSHVKLGIHSLTKGKTY